MQLHARDFDGADDLRQMQELAAACTGLQAPFATTHVGDLAWRRYQHLDVLDRVRIRLWADAAGTLVAWGWVPLAGELDFQIHPEADPAVTHAVLAWFEQTEAGPQTTAWALSTDDRTIAALGDRGYVQGDDEWYEHLVFDLSAPPAARAVPDGYVVRPVRGEEELDERVEVHRAAFAPSRVVPESYRNVMRAWPYRAPLDHVAVAPDGSFAAFALGWLDERNAIGELEPVGTHPDHRRLGLASAVCASTLRALHEAGARTCLVYSVGGSTATGLYTGIGFEQRARHLPFRRGIPG